MGAYYSREQKVRVNSNTGQNILAVDDSVYVQGTNATVQEIASIQADNQTDLVNAGLTGRSGGNRNLRLQQQPQQQGPQGNRIPVQATAEMGNWYTTEMHSEKTVKVYNPQGQIIYEDKDKKDFKSSHEAAQNMMVKTASSNVHLMKTSLEGITNIQRSNAIQSGSQNIVTN